MKKETKNNILNTLFALTLILIVLSGFSLYLFTEVNYRVKSDKFCQDRGFDRGEITPSKKFICYNNGPIALDRSGNIKYTFNRDKLVFSKVDITPFDIKVD